MCFSSSNAQFLIILLMRKSAMKCILWTLPLIFPKAGSGFAITIYLRFLVGHSRQNRNSLVKQETDTYGYTKYGIMATTQFPSTYPLALRRRFRKKVISSLHGMVHPSAKSFGLRMVHTMSLWLVSFLYMKLS